MAKFLTQEWLDLQKDLAQEFPERPGATARMQYKVTGTPEGDVTFHTVTAWKVSTRTSGARCVMVTCSLLPAVSVVSSATR